MKKIALMKDILRDIKRSKGRFISIVAIIALGVAFFSGVKIAPEDMEYTADKYYDDYNLMDIRVVSTLGLTEEDVESIGKVDNVENVFGTYIIDTLAEFNEKEVVLRVHSFTSEEQINGTKLIEGRYPNKADECLLEAGNANYLRIPIGSRISLSSGKDEDLSETIANTEFTVVGSVQTPYYLSFENGNSNIGNGQLRDFIMIPEENFKLEIYTDVFLTVNGAKKLNSYKDEYFDLIDPVTEGLKEISKDREKTRYDEIIGETREKLNEGKKTYYIEKSKAEKELADALAKIEDGRKELKEGKGELATKERDFNKTIKEGKEKLEEAERQLIEGEEEYENALLLFNEQKSMAEVEFQKAKEEIEQGEGDIILLEGQIEDLNQALQNPLLVEEERMSLARDLQTAEYTLLAMKDAIEKGKKELEANKEMILKEEEEFNKNKELLDLSREQLEIEKINLAEGEKKGLIEIKNAKKKIEDGQVDLDKGEIEYFDGKEEAERELEKAFEDIEDAEREINKIEKAKWYILDRKSHYSYMDYGGAADRIDAIAKVFPVFFALVAALVCLTTMTRMVDEQRGNIGTLKALGYGRFHIASKYIFYALFATILGCVIGIGVGYTLFPTVIFNAYGIMYVLPPITLVFNKFLALSISIGAIGLTTITSFSACNKELKENPASLMRPKAPKLGKKILVERIPFIWNRFNFSYKVSIRNIFRYKRRFFMTVFGIAGCTALMLTAFGIKDSIKTVIDRQFGVLFTYDMTVGLELHGERHLKDNEKIEEYELLLREGGSLSKGEIKKDITIIVPKDISEIDRFIHLQDRKNEEHISIEEKGLVITEQVSKSLNISVGDDVLLRNSEDKEVVSKITAITENYTSNYVYLSPNHYEDMFLEDIEYNEVVATTKDNSEEFEEELSRELIAKKGISSVSFNTSIKNSFKDTIESLDFVVLVMIISAGALAFVVLYNLTNVNISERIREIATIKVLGFYDSEVSVYIYRENTILTIIGTIAGLGLGIILHRFIMTTVEMDNIMFGLKLEPKSYIYSIILTLVFAILVNLAMYYKLKNVEMVESLKSVD